MGRANLIGGKKKRIIRGKKVKERKRETETERERERERERRRERKRVPGERE